MRTVHVALVENDPSLNRAYSRLLRARGYTVTSYSSAEEFLACGADGCDCLVLDIDLDGMSGLALQRLLRAENRLVPIVFITGGDDAATQSQAHAQDCKGYISKPFTSAQLCAAIKVALR
jgi:FixJ family two-component response regulator